MGEELIVKHDPNEALTLQKVGTGLFKSGLFPNAKNEFGAFAIVEYGHELGIGPMMSLKNINIISGQLACNAQLMLSLAMSRGVTYEVTKETDKGAELIFKRQGWEPYKASFTEQDAKDAGLLSKDNWKKYPRDMYFWRAVAKGVRRIAPEAVMGLYTAEEISEGKYADVINIPPGDATKGESESNKGSTTEIEPNLRTKVMEMLYDISGQDLGKVPELLKQYSAYRAKSASTGEQKYVEGKTDVKDISDKAINVVYAKVKKAWEEAGFNKQLEPIQGEVIE